jgi:hypothetical protein
LNAPLVPSKNYYLFFPHHSCPHFFFPWSTTSLHKSHFVPNSIPFPWPYFNKLALHAIMVLCPTLQFLFSTWKLWEEPNFFWEGVVMDLLMVGRSFHFFYFSAIFIFILVSISLTIAAAFFSHMSLWPFALLCHFTRRLLEDKWIFIFFVVHGVHFSYQSFWSIFACMFIELDICLRPWALTMSNVKLSF